MTRPLHREAHHQAQPLRYAPYQASSGPKCSPEVSSADLLVNVSIVTANSRTEHLSETCQMAL
jgi:hypothetical protein